MRESSVYVGAVEVRHGVEARLYARHFRGRDYVVVEVDGKRLVIRLDRVEGLVAGLQGVVEASHRGPDDLTAAWVERLARDEDVELVR